MYQLGRENLCFLLSERRLKGGVGVFPWEASERQDRGFFAPKSTLFKTRERRRGYGSFPHRKDQRLHGHVQLPPAGQVAVPESEGDAVPHAVAAGGLGLHHEGGLPVSARTASTASAAESGSWRRTATPREKSRTGQDGMRKRESYRALILENIEYDVLSQNVQLDKDRLDELVDLMVDTVCSNREMIRVAGDDYPAEVVRSRFLKLNASHIEYVLDRIRENTTQVRNIKKYLLAALYNAPVTMDSYYTSLVSHDLYGSGDRR